MPYNTRRKSLSLPSLGIHVPVTHAARAAANRLSTSPSNTPSTTSSTSATMPSPSSRREDHHPSKKLKRSHNESSPQQLSKKREVRTPPPSPPPSNRASVEMTDADAAQTTRIIDLEGINDEIVEAVIIQLQNTANRPHLVKELAAVLMQRLKIVQQ
jgi:hypothetical protein